MNNIIKRKWNKNSMVIIEDLQGMAFQAESGGHTFQISGIDDDGNTVSLTGTPSGVLLRPDNTDVALTCSVSGGVVSATLPANCYDVPGRFGLTIFITSGSSKTAIYAAVGTVTRTSSGTVAPGTSQSVVDLINAINAAVNSIPASYSALLADIAPTYSDSALYSVGQYAWCDGDLKRCIVPITTAESYTAAHWTSAVLGQDVSDLKSAFNTGTIPTLLNPGELVTGEAIKSTTGAFISLSGYKRTGYIELPNVATIKLIADTANNSDINTINFYNSSYSRTGGVLNPLEQTSINIPANSVYAAYSGVSAVMDTAYIVYEADTKINEIEDELNEFEDNVQATKADAYSFASKKYVDNLVPLQNVNGIVYFPNNLVDPSECVNNVYISTIGGGTAGSSDYFATGFIPVTAGTEYKANVGRNLAWYKSDKTFLSGVSGTGIQSGVTAPENAAYIRFSVKKADDTSTPDGLYFTAKSNFVTGVQIPGLITNPWCYGKTINWIGDSIVDTSDFDNYVCSALNLTQLTVDGSTGGINGSTIALKGDGTNTRHALCERYDDMPPNADLIAVSCGTNDWMYAWSPIGTINDPDDGTSNTTFYGALKALCKGLIDRYPQKVIFFTTPIKRGQAFASGAGGEYTPDGVMTTPFSKNKYGKTLMDYADIIKEVCGYYSIPVLDMYRESLLNPHISSQQDMFDDVLTHPYATGSKIMARRVTGWITQLGYNIP